MSQAMPSEHAGDSAHTARHVPTPVYHAYRFLQVAFVLAPIIAGIDKFFHRLTDWDKYLAPVFNNILGGHGHKFMLAVGCIEIIAGIGVAILPKIFSYVVAVWLACIIINLLFVPYNNPDLNVRYFDIALRDLGLFLAALALGRLSQVVEKQ